MILTIDHRIKAIESEIDVLRSKIEEHGTGHIHTTIRVLDQRLDEMYKERQQQLEQRNK